MSGEILKYARRYTTPAKVLPFTHFTCIGNTRESIREQLKTYLDSGIDHILAMRGDLPKGWKVRGVTLSTQTSL